MGRRHSAQPSDAELGSSSRNSCISSVRCLNCSSVSSGDSSSSRIEAASSPSSGVKKVLVPSGLSLHVAGLGRGDFSFCILGVCQTYRPSLTKDQFGFGAGAATKEEPAMRNSIPIARALSLLITPALCIAALACGTSSPPVQPSPVTNAVPAETQATPEPTAQPKFEATLEGEDLAKFQGLPSEFQDALRQEFDEAGEAKALGYLRGLPDKTPPISEMLEPAALGWFGVLQPSDQRFLLLEGYPEIYQRNAQAGRDFQGIKFSYKRMVEVVFDNRGVKLPPIKEALSADAQAKLDSMDAPLSRAFRLAWDEAKPRPTDVGDLVKRVEGSLLRAPTEMPSLAELGLSNASIAQFRALPAEMRDWLWKRAAGELVTTGSLSFYSVMSDEYIRVLSEPEALVTFNRGIMPVPEDSHVGTTFACLGGPFTWPDPVAARMPESFGDRPAVFLPPFEDALSAEALGRLNELDANLRAAFEDRWKWSGPFSPQKAFCEITKLERGIIYAPTTTAPAAQDLLSEEGRSRYKTLSGDARRELDRMIADSIILGVAFGTGEGTPVMSFSSSADDFLNALEADVEEMVMLWTDDSNSKDS